MTEIGIFVSTFARCAGIILACAVLFAAFVMILHHFLWNRKAKTVIGGAKACVRVHNEGTKFMAKELSKSINDTYEKMFNTIEKLDRY